MNAIAASAPVSARAHVAAVSNDRRRGTAWTDADVCCVSMMLLEFCNELSTKYSNGYFAPQHPCGQHIGVPDEGQRIGVPEEGQRIRPAFRAGLMTSINGPVSRIL